MVRHLTFITILVFVITQSALSANILFACIIGSYSHHIAIHSLAVRMVENGHNVTYLSSLELKMNHPKITYFYPKSVIKMMSGILNSIGDDSDRVPNAPNGFTYIYPVAVQLCEIMYENTQVQDWMKKSSYELVVIDAVYSDCVLGLAYKFKAPHIMFNPTSFFAWQHDVYGVPPESSWIPDFRLNYTQEMGFFERVYNTVFTLQMYLSLMTNDYYPALTTTIRNGLRDQNVPPVEELQRKMSLMFVNTYFAVEYARSLPPNIIPVGGLHCSIANQTLTPEIKEFVSKFEKNGFVFVSFGTAFKLSDDTFYDLVQMMSLKFPEIGFILKWSKGFSEAASGNVLLVPWAPQQLLLAHPKIRAFVSHCGMLSVNEAAYYGVPVVAIPGFVDQDYNAELLVRNGVARRLELSTLSQDNLEESLREVMFNPKYKTRMEMISDVYRDRPEHALDTAVWWTEFVLRHSKKGSDLGLLRPLGMNQHWFQRRLIDVYAFILLALSVAIFVSVKLIFMLTRLFQSLINSKSSSNNVKIDRKKKQT